jgi:acetolactate decarboxylase
MGKLFQASTIFALLSGNFDYTISIDYFMRNGDTGIGSYNGLNGEAIFLDGKAYNATASGQVKIMDIPMTGVTFGQITKFVPVQAGQEIQIGPFSSFADLTEKLKPALIKGPNYFYVIRAEGVFKTITVRSSYKQRKPFRPMPIVVGEMKYYQYSEIEGTLVGVYSPAYAEGLSVKGWHLHFLSADKTHGGHVTDLSGDKLTVSANLEDKYEIKLAPNREFAEGDFSKEKMEAGFASYTAPAAHVTIVPPEPKKEAAPAAEAETAAPTAAAEAPAPEKAEEEPAPAAEPAVKA